VPELEIAGPVDGAHTARAELVENLVPTKDALANPVGNVSGHGVATSPPGLPVVTHVEQQWQEPFHISDPEWDTVPGTMIESGTLVYSWECIPFT
jgi:hypothetical protein